MGLGLLSSRSWSMILFLFHESSSDGVERRADFFSSVGQERQFLTRICSNVQFAANEENSFCNCVQRSSGDELGYVRQK